jgi:hypothetical protein
MDISELGPRSAWVIPRSPINATMARLHTRPLSYWVGLVIEVRLDEGSPSRLHSCHELPSQTQL